MDIDNIGNELKALIVRKGLTMREVVNRLNEKYNRNDCSQNLHNKLRKGTIRFREVLEIAEILGYEIVFKE